jgi:hypothetical protein
MKLFTVFVGDTTDDLCVTAKQFDSSAYLIDGKNVCNKHSGTVYVSIGDLSTTSEFFNLLSAADKIVYSPPETWSDKKTSSQPYSIAWITEHYVRLVATLYNIPTENVPVKKSVTSDPVARKTPNQQIWLSGCSTTFGIGVEKNQRYGNIVAQTMDLDLVDLSYPGSSIAWARDEILKSDIKEKDIVIWGITTKDRFCWFNGVTMTHVNPAHYLNNPEFDKIIPLSSLDCDHRLYESLSAIQQVNNFCSKIGAHLILINVHGNLNLLDECAKYKGFVIMHGSTGIDWDRDFLDFLDFGNDQLHPGPKTHQHYANLVLEKIKDLNIGIVT